MNRKKALKSFLFLTLIIVLISYLYLKYSWLTLYSFDDMKHNARIVDSSASPPINFSKIWDRLYPNSRKVGMNSQLWSDITRELGNTTYRNCKCDEIGYLAFDNDNHHFKLNIENGIGKYRRFGYGLQYYTTPEKCFDFWLNNGIVWNGKYLKSLGDLATITHKKTVESLTEAETIELIAYRTLSYRRTKDSLIFKQTVENLTSKLKEN